GWISSSFVERVAATGGRVTATSLNARAGPSTSDAVLVTLARATSTPTRPAGRVVARDPARRTGGLRLSRLHERRHAGAVTLTATSGAGAARAPREPRSPRARARGRASGR